jgi:hypothetical protein
MNSCGGFVVETTSCLIVPGSVRQVNGVGVAGMGVGDAVAVIVTVGETTVWAWTTSFDGKQAESSVKSSRQAMVRMA